MSRTVRKVRPGYIDGPYWWGRSLTIGTNRDGKQWYKPSKVFKKITKRSRKAKERQAMRDGRDAPRFRKSDEWEYL